MNKKVSSISVLLSLAFFCVSTANAQERESNLLIGQDLDLAQLNKDTEITVEVYDSVTNGCWLNTSRSKSLVERELLDAGYTKIVDERVWGALIAIEVLGYETPQNRCATHISYALSLPDADYRGIDEYEWIAFDYADVVTFSVLLTGPKSNMSQRIHENIEGFTNELLVDVQQAKNELADAIMESGASQGAQDYLNSLYAP